MASYTSLQMVLQKPRQIIVRLRDSTTKRRILKASNDLKDREHFAYVNINEDLTKTRNTLAYRARQLKRKRFISQTWTVDVKIFVRNNRDLVTTILPLITDWNDTFWTTFQMLWKSHIHLRKNQGLQIYHHNSSLIPPPCFLVEVVLEDYQSLWQYLINTKRNRSH